MATNFPTSIDTLTNPTATDTLDSPSHSSQHTNSNDAIEALEAKVGADSSAVTTSHDYKLGGVSGTDKAASLTGTETLTNKTLTSPTVTSPTINTAISGTAVLDDDTMATASATTIATSESIKAYVDSNPGSYISASSSDTLTNKTIDANGTGNSISNLEVADFTAATIVTEADTIAGNDNDTTLPTSAAVKDYVDTNTAGLGTKQQINTSDVTIDNSTTETDVFNTTISAGALGTNNGYRFKIYISDLGIEESLSPESALSIDLQYGSTTLATVSVSSQTNQLAGGTGVIEGYIVAGGTTSSQEGYIEMRIYRDGTSVNLDSISGCGMVVSSGSAAEDSTGALALKVTAQWNQADSNNQVTFANSIIEKITA